MRKRFPYVLVLAAALATATSLCAQTTVFIPIPETGGGNVVTQVEFHGASSGFANATFVPAGVNGIPLGGSTQQVNNFFRPNVWDVTNNITGGGLLILNANAPLSFTATSFQVFAGSAETAWQLPTIAPGSWFGPGSTAHLAQLGRDANGGVTHLQVVNFTRKTAHCTAQLQRPKGTFVGAPITFSVPAVSSATVADILATAGYSLVAPVIRAMVSCDQAFYPFATFATPSRLNVRVMYPLDAPSAPPSKAVTMNIPGTFFVPRNGDSDLQMDVPLVPNTSYRVLSIDYDLTINQFDFVFDVLLGMYHHGGPRFNKTLYFGTFVRGLRRRYIIDLGSPSLEVDLKFDYPLAQGGTYHIRIVYDAEHATITNLVFDNHGNLLLVVQGGTFNNDLADRGNPVVIDWGVGGVADGAYFPPLGWRFANLHLVATQ
ncbi:MAG TPA: hypothetical protein VHR45_21795 [Thermoanaerobaculia bacterium]|nr:hypothetical protein [Thermoanaerobaculia bacterium]